MADLKRWIVTYTKHIKQKRKVYQDGLLELQVSTNKLLLYDDCEKLLECRILKRDEIVSCGETLTFNAFLVDVNVAEGIHEPSNLNGKSQQSRMKNKSQNLSLSPSHKIIRDFKKREILKYEAIQHSKSPETAKTIITEWEALYTTQITQKAKKFQDGFLQLSVRGSHGRQVMVLDLNRNNVVSKFLKKDDKLESGGTILLDGYLVQIGEPLLGHDSSGENNFNVLTKENKVYAHNNSTLHKVSESIKTETQKNVELLSSQDTIEPSSTEWQVLYTTQLTQKSKKYHDGFLQLALCGSHGRQAMLYDATKTVLHSRFLRKEDVIRTGVSFKFDAYLIQIGEFEGKRTTDNSNDAGNSFNVNTKMEKIAVKQTSLPSKSYALKASVVGKSLSNAKVYTKESSERLPMNKPVRDASQILSFLQKPRIENSTAKCFTENEPTEERPVSNAEDLDFLKDNQLPNLKSSVSPDKLSEFANTMPSRESTELDIPPDTKSTKGFTEMPSGCNLKLDSHIRNSSQNPFSEVEAETGLVDVKSHCDDISSAREMDEYPNFDLGFEI